MPALAPVLRLWLVEVRLVEAVELALAIDEEVNVALRLLECLIEDLEVGAVLEVAAVPEVGDVWMVKVWEPTEAARIAV